MSRASKFYCQAGKFSNFSCLKVVKDKIWAGKFSNLNSSPPSAAYMRQWIGSALVQIMACRLFGAKPLSKPLLGYCQLNPQEQTSSETLIKIQKFSFTKIHLKISSAKWWPFCRGGDELMHWLQGSSPSNGRQKGMLYKSLLCIMPFLEVSLSSCGLFSLQLEKFAKKQAKRDRLERQAAEVARCRNVFILQNTLDSMGSEEVRADFLKGNNGAVVSPEPSMDK